MIRLSEIRIELDDCENKQRLFEKAQKLLRIPKSQIKSMKVSKRSIDCRKKDDIFFSFAVDVEVFGDEEELLKKVNTKKASIVNIPEYVLPETKFNSALRPVVVGFGPAGMFCALTLARAHLKPIVLEQGAKVEKRIGDISSFFEKRVLNERSNVQFGEGGAGTFSDGKLTTGIKSPFVKKVFDEFVLHGAPEEILYSGTPHIGTDRLVDVVKKIRNEIISLGGEILFDSKLEEIDYYNDFIQSISYSRDGKNNDLECDTLVLAIGHSARDTVKMLSEKGITMIQKPFSIGARIEHPREYIDTLQYGRFANHRALPAAVYKLSAHYEHARGGYTFCMCPGGTVISSTSERNCVVTNGMSRFARDGENSNSAILANVYPEDFPSSDPLYGFEFQRRIEQRAYELGGGDYSAPAQLLGDFLKGTSSRSFASVKPTMTTGSVPGDIRKILPQKITDTMAYAITQWDSQMKGFALEDAVLTAPETRSSSPVRLIRDDVFQTNIRGIYPCGEGAGYAGGIVSAAVDGIKCAHAVLGGEH